MVYVILHISFIVHAPLQIVSLCIITVAIAERTQTGSVLGSQYLFERDITVLALKSLNLTLLSVVNIRKSARRTRQCFEGSACEGQQFMADKTEFQAIYHNLRNAIITPIQTRILH